MSLMNEEKHVLQLQFCNINFLRGNHMVNTDMVERKAIQLHSCCMDDNSIFDNMFTANYLKQCYVYI